MNIDDDVDVSLSPKELRDLRRDLARRDAQVTAVERERTREMASLVVRLVTALKRYDLTCEQIPWIGEGQARASALLGKAPVRGRKVMRGSA